MLAPGRSCRAVRVPFAERNQAMTTLDGYIGRILDVDLTRGTHTVRELDPELANRFIGGTGLGAYLLYQEGVYRADPLGPDNVLIFGGGPFSGTSIPLSNRFGVCAR